MVVPYIMGAGLLCALAAFSAEFLVKPKTRHAGLNFKIVLINLSIFGFIYGLMLLLSGKIIFSATVTFLLYCILIVVNNAKYLNLMEPLVFSDYDYFTDAFRFPRLYIPFLGVSGILGIMTAVAVIICGFCIDPSHINRFTDPVVAASVMGIETGCLLILWFTRDIKNLNTFNIREDLNNLGFAVFLWSYFLAYLEKPAVKSPFESFASSGADVPSEKDQDKNENRKANELSHDGNAVIPNLIAIQSESFFDPREWNPNIKEDVLKDYDSILAESLMCGKMKVPAWGANTIRTEFSFLTGISPEDMKGHRFSPYQISSTSWKIVSLVNFLKSRGYHTVCIHPYHTGFYHRDVIFKKWQFDEFLDIRSFTKADKFGPYVSDAAIADRMLGLCEEWNGRSPLFIFMITMENHGPLNLESITEEEVQGRFKDRVSDDFRELAIYLRHISNENDMLKKLTGNFREKNYPVSMVFYGDHVPILPKPYAVLGEPEGSVPYFIWNCNVQSGGGRKLLNGEIHDLPVMWLKGVF